MSLPPSRLIPKPGSKDGDRYDQIVDYIGHQGATNINFIASDIGLDKNSLGSLVNRGTIKKVGKTDKNRNIYRLAYPIEIGVIA